MNRSFFVFTLLLLASCASPREKAYQAAVRDYQHSEREVAAYARAEVKQLVTATRVFHATVGRWPQTFMEFGRWVTDTSQPLDELVTLCLDYILDNPEQANKEPLCQTH